MARPRPVAGLPALSASALARTWLARLVADAPLAEAPRLASPRFVLAGPSICAAVLGALADDAAVPELDRAGAELAELLEPAAAGAGARAAGPERTASPATHAVQVVEELRAATAQELLPGTDPALQPAAHDRLAHVCSLLGQAALGAPAPGAITVRDARASLDPRACLVGEAERLVRTGARFALLAVEVDDAAVLPAGVLGAAEAAAQAVLPAEALHAPDGPGSLLVLAPGDDGRELARAVARAVAEAATHHGAPLRAASGVARHPEDGDSLEDLLARADGQLFAARAEGLPHA